MQINHSDHGDDSSNLATANNIKLLLDMERSGVDRKEGLFSDCQHKLRKKRTLF